MRQSICQVGFAYVLCCLMIPSAYGQLRSSDSYQRDSDPQRGQQGRQGMVQPRGLGQGEGRDRSKPRPDGMRGRQDGQQRDGQRGPGGGQGSGWSGNPVVLALDTNRDGELSADEIADAAEALKRLDEDGDGRLSREELRPPVGGRGDRPGPGRLGDPDQLGPPDQFRGPGQRDRDERRPDGGGPGGQLANWPTAEHLQAPTPLVPDSLKNLPPAPIPGFVTIPAGQFEMGDHHELGGMEHGNDEIPIHTVRIDGFYMASTETTNRQYCTFLNDALSQGTIRVQDGVVYGRNGSEAYCDTDESDSASSIRFDGRQFTVEENRDRHPVVCIRWFGAAACCNWMSQQHGYQPCYDLTTGDCDYSKKGFRLPTEAEWEYAGRGGLYETCYIFPWGNVADLAKGNWPNSGDPFETGTIPLTTPVGFYNGELRRREEFAWPGQQSSYQTHDGANGYGLHDMAGNVWEWVGDWYGRQYYADSPSDNPTGPEQGQPMLDGKPYRVLRGGSWYNGQYGHSRVSNRNPSYYRGPDDPNHSFYHIGFRAVLQNPNSK